MVGQAMGQLAEGKFRCRYARSESVRLSAAQAILELGPKLRKSVEFE